MYVFALSYLFWENSEKHLSKRSHIMVESVAMVNVYFQYFINLSAPIKLNEDAVLLFDKKLDP